MSKRISDLKKRSFKLEKIAKNLGVRLNGWAKIETFTTG